MEELGVALCKYGVSLEQYQASLKTPIKRSRPLTEVRKSPRLSPCDPLTEVRKSPRLSPCDPLTEVRKSPRLSTLTEVRKSPRLFPSRRQQTASDGTAKLTI